METKTSAVRDADCTAWRAPGVSYAATLLRRLDPSLLVRPFDARKSDYCGTI
jgi:hypothetical protein